MKEASIERFERLGIIIAVLLFLLFLRALGTAITAMHAYLLPLILATFLMFVINPIIAFFERRRLPGPLAVLLSILLFALIFGLIVKIICENVPPLRFLAVLMSSDVSAPGERTQELDLCEETDSRITNPNKIIIQRNHDYTELREETAYL